MHLHHQPRKKNGITYDYYSVVESLWNNGSPKKRILFRLGKLTPLQVQQIRGVLKVIKSSDAFVTTFKDIIFKNHQRYLDVAFVSQLWDQWSLSELFPTAEQTTESRGKFISTSKIAKMLTIYRCLDPGSYLSAVNWFKSTALDIILSIDGDHINKTRLLDELDEIEKCKESIEKYLYKKLKEYDKEDLRVIFYDLTDSYFHGRKCDLTVSGITKSNGFQSNKIVLALLVNSEGYPFAWDILEDYTADVSTLKGLSSELKVKFKIGNHEVVWVFDRGMVSDENLKHLEDEKQLYITALDKNQIPTIKEYLFSLKPEDEQYLKKGIVSDALRKIFDDNKLSLPDKAKIIKKDKKDDEHWSIRDKDRTYIIKKENGQANIYGNIDLSPFTSLDEENMIKEVINMGFEKHDDNTYHKEITVLGGRRHVLIFNPEMFLDEQKTRAKKIQEGLDYLKKENIPLSKAKKSRNEKTTRGKIDKKLKGVRNFIDYCIEPDTVEYKGKTVNTFKIVPKETDETKNAIKKAKRTDGLWAVVSNVPDKNNDKKGLTPGDLIDNG